MVAKFLGLSRLTDSCQSRISKDFGIGKSSSDTGSPVQEFCLGADDNPHRLNWRNRRANGARRFGTRPSKSPTAARDRIVQGLDGAGASESVNYYLLWQSPSLHRPIRPIRRRAEKCLRATAERDCHRFSRRADLTHQGLTLLWFHRLGAGRRVPRATQRQRHHRRRFKKARSRSPIALSVRCMSQWGAGSRPSAPDLHRVTD